MSPVKTPVKKEYVQGEMSGGMKMQLGSGLSL